MEKGFKDIEEYFLKAESKILQRKLQHKKTISGKRDNNLVLQIKNLNDKLKGKDRKIKELFAEIAELRDTISKLKEREKRFEELKKEIENVESYKKSIENLKKEIALLKGEIAEKDREIKNLKAQELPKSRVELFIEVALNALSPLAAGREDCKVLFSRRFRKDMVKEVSVRPFLFDSFISALSRISSTSRLLKREAKHDIYRLRVTSPYGEYRAIYLKMDSKTLKFVRFGQRDSIYQELDACDWKFE